MQNAALKLLLLFFATNNQNSEMIKKFPLLAAPLLLLSCSGNTDDSITYDVTAEQTAPASTLPTQHPQTTSVKTRLTGDNPDTDSEPYRMGRRHAEKLHRCSSREEICDELLDINARLSNIQNRISQKAGNDYLCGIRDYLKEQNDTLAATLF